MEQKRKLVELRDKYDWWHHRDVNALLEMAYDPVGVSRLYDFLKDESWSQDEKLEIIAACRRSANSEIQENALDILGEFMAFSRDMQGYPSQWLIEMFSTGATASTLKAQQEGS